MAEDIVVRDARADDAAGIARIIVDNGARYQRLAPDLFQPPAEEGLADFIGTDSDWRDAPSNLALVALVDGDVAGYLEASIHEPLETARYQTQRELAHRRLAISFVGTADAYKRRGVATQLVDAAEAWGRKHGAVVAVCDTWLGSPMSVPFWEERMGYTRHAVILRKRL